MAKEYLLTTNEYNEPKVLDGKDAIAAKLLMILNMRPGTNPLHPEMGVDLSGRYRFCDEEDIEDLQDEINAQLIAYFPDFNTVSVTVSMETQNDVSIIRTIINIDDTLYAFDSNEDETIISLAEMEESEDDIPDDPEEDYSYLDEDDDLYIGTAEDSLDGDDAFEGEKNYMETY